MSQGRVKYYVYVDGIKDDQVFKSNGDANSYARQKYKNLTKKELKKRVKVIPDYD